MNGELIGTVPSGTIVGYWTVIAEAPRRQVARGGKHPNKFSSQRYLLCRCICGKEQEIFIGNLRSGASASCGCHHPNRTHGMSKAPEYTLWRQMIQRCHNPNNTEYRNYGARGIHVCERWREGFLHFFADMGARPHPTLTLDRINNDGHYEPGNVRWATRVQQVANTRLTLADRKENGRIGALKRWHQPSTKST